MIYYHERKEGNFHFKWCLFRHRPGQGILDDFRFKGLVYVVCTIDTLNRELFVNECTERTEIDVLVFLTFQGNCNRRWWNWTHLFSHDVYKAVHLETLKNQRNISSFHSRQNVELHFCTQCSRAPLQVYSERNTPTQRKSLSWDY